MEQLGDKNIENSSIYTSEALLKVPDDFRPNPDRHATPHHFPPKNSGGRILFQNPLSRLK
jgi:hypothetical protein